MTSWLLRLAHSALRLVSATDLHIQDRNILFQ